VPNLLALPAPLALDLLCRGYLFGSGLFFAIVAFILLLGQRTLFLGFDVKLVTLLKFLSDMRLVAAF
jgi:hypothetical protein